jgi:hypothetical protein
MSKNLININNACIPNKILSDTIYPLLNNALLIEGPQGPSGPQGGGGSLEIGGDIIGGTASSVLFVGNSGILNQDTSGLVYNVSSKRLGVGVSSPTAALHAACSSSSSKAAVFQGASGQSANITEIQNSNGDILHSFDGSGVTTINHTAEGGTSYFSYINNVSESAATSVPFLQSYGGTPFTNTPIGGGAPTSVIDNVFAQGWERVPGELPGYTENWEHYWHTQYMTERHGNFTSIDGTVAYRPWYWIINNETYRLNRIDRGYIYDWFGRLGTFPLLRILTNDNDSGSVIIQNDGTAPPLQVTSPGGNVSFTLNPDGAILAQCGINATSDSPIHNGVGLFSIGTYWTGSASSGATTGIQTIVAGNNDFHLLATSGNANYRFMNNGRIGANVTTDRITENIVMSPGYLASINNDTPANATYRLIGLNATDQVDIDTDRRGVVFGTGIQFSESDFGNGRIPIVTLGLTGTTGSPNGIDATISTWFQRRVVSREIWIGTDTDTGATRIQGSGGLTVSCGASGTNNSLFLSTSANYTVANSCRILFGPHFGFLPANANCPFMEGYNDLSSNGGVDGGLKFGTYYSSGDGLAVRLKISPIGFIGIHETSPGGQLHVTTSSATTIGTITRAAPSQTANLSEWQDNNGNPLSSIKFNGSYAPPSLADSAAANNSIYYSTTQSKLCYKDPGGVSNPLY